MSVPCGSPEHVPVSLERPRDCCTLRAAQVAARELLVDQAGAASSNPCQVARVLASTQVPAMSSNVASGSPPS